MSSLTEQAYYKFKKAILESNHLSTNVFSSGNSLEKVNKSNNPVIKMILDDIRNDTMFRNDNGRLAYLDHWKVFTDNYAGKWLNEIVEYAFEHTENFEQCKPYIRTLLSIPLSLENGNFSFEQVWTKRGLGDIWKEAEEIYERLTIQRNPDNLRLFLESLKAPYTEAEFLHGDTYSNPIPIELLKKIRQPLSNAWFRAKLDYDQRNGLPELKDFALNRVDWEKVKLPGVLHYNDLRKYGIVQRKLMLFSDVNKFITQTPYVYPIRFIFKEGLTDEALTLLTEESKEPELEKFEKEFSKVIPEERMEQLNDKYYNSPEYKKQREQAQDEEEERMEKIGDMSEEEFKEFIRSEKEKLFEV